MENSSSCPQHYYITIVICGTLCVNRIHWKQWRGGPNVCWQKQRDLWLALSPDWDLSHGDQMNGFLDFITSRFLSSQTLSTF